MTPPPSPLKIDPSRFPKAPKKQKPKITPAEQARRTAKQLWLVENRGILSTVAQSFTPPKKPNYVSMVFWGDRRNAEIEKALKKLKAPI